MKVNPTIKNGVIVGVIMLIISSSFESVRSFFLKFINSVFLSVVAVPLWILIILILLSLVLVTLFIKRLQAPHFTSYKEDVFDGMRWRWGYDSSYQIKSLTPFCLNDDTVMVHSEDVLGASTFFICETCKSRLGRFRGNYSENIFRVKRQIDRKARNKQFAK